MRSQSTSLSYSNDLPVVTNQYPYVVVLDNRQSLPFSYHYGTVHHDAMLQRTISCCSASCSHWNEERAVTCHQACMIFAAKFETFQPSSFFSFLFAQKQPTIPAMTVLDSGYKAHLMREKQTSSSWTMRKLLTSLQLSPIDTSAADASDGSPISRMWSATNYWYEPPHIEETRRRDTTVESIRRGLAVNVDPRGKLPWEILTMIANYLVPEFAITELLTTPRANDSRFTVSKDVWATYVYIDGTEYVSSLSNLRSDKARLVLQAASTCPDNAIYILEDHLGIRRVEISSNPPKLADPSDRSMWWRSLPIQEDELVFASDVSPSFFLRLCNHGVFNRTLTKDRLSRVSNYSVSENPAISTEYLGRHQHRHSTRRACLLTTFLPAMASRGWFLLTSTRRAVLATRLAGARSLGAAPSYIYRLIVQEKVLTIIGIQSAASLGTCGPICPSRRTSRSRRFGAGRGDRLSK